MKPNQYIFIYGWMITDLDLKDSDLLLYAYIYGNGSQDWKVSSTIDQISDELKIPRRTLLRSTVKLQEQGLITITRNGKIFDYEACGKGKIIRCQNGTDKNSIGAKMAPSRCQNGTDSRCQNGTALPLIIESVNNNFKNNTDARLASYRFNRFYGFYPEQRRIKNRIEAEALWDSQNCLQSYENIMGCISFYSHHDWLDDDGRWIPGMKKFIGEKYWIGHNKRADMNLFDRATEEFEILTPEERIQELKNLQDELGDI